jgi:tetratricopeptide (TPR) repeat protein
MRRGGGAGRRVLVVAASVILTACAARVVTPPGPVTSPTGYVYPVGTPPTETRYSQTATLYMTQENFERALEQALEGVAAEPGNPIHYFIAGSCYAQLGQLESADEMFADAQRIYPAYELDIEPERERAWALAFNEGIEAYGEGDVEVAIEAWNRATVIFDLRSEAHRNLAVLLAVEGRYDEAIEVYQRALGGLEARPATRVLTEAEIFERDSASISIEEDLAELLLYSARYEEAEPLVRAKLDRDPGNVDLRNDLATVLTGLERHAEAAEIYSGLLNADGLEAVQLYNIGVALFRSGDYVGASRGFKRLTEIQPGSRDAWFNYANALFAAESWPELAAAGDRLVELDPLSETAGLIAARAHLEAGDEPGARSGLAQTEARPVYLEQLRVQSSGAETQVVGRLVGNVAQPGTSLRLRFEFFADQASLGTQIVTVTAPPPDASETFEVSFNGQATAYRYEVLP